MKAMLKLWRRDEEKAAKQMLLGKTANERFSGLSASKRNEAKFFLVAVLPILVVIPFTGTWSTTNNLGRGIIVSVCVWAAGVMATYMYFLVRSMARAMNRKKG